MSVVFRRPPRCEQHSSYQSSYARLNNPLSVLMHGSFLHSSMRKGKCGRRRGQFEETESAVNK
eukprot:7231987-Pyramimonas_sp.AAC.2